MSWETRPFADVVKDVTGGNLKTKQNEYSENGAFPIVDQGQALVGGFTNDEDKVCKAELPVIIFGDHTKTFKFIDFPFCLGADGTKVLRPRNGDDPKFLYYALQTAHIPDAGYSRHFKYLKEASIPLPPLAEQKRIAAILDQADALRSLRERAIGRLNMLGQAIFHEMFGSAEHEELVELKALGEVKTGTTPSTKIAEYFDGDIPFITPGDLETNRPAARYLSALGAEKSRSVSAGSTLVCCIGATIGKTDIAREDCTFNQQINAVEWGDKILPDYGYYAIRQLRPEIERIGRGASTTLPILKKSLFQELRIPVANRAKQEEFGDRIKTVEKQKSAYALGEIFTAKLFSSLQHRAFQGGL